MFQKILIANRGEIACRVAATARRMGIKTVAVYADADAQAQHVAACDEAVHIGGSAPNDSYLRWERILEAARATGAQAIHPGYGFLSENEDFARACAAAGVVFIGPPPGAIRAMGLKAESKRLMGAAGVPLVPGYHGADQHPQLLEREADHIGYPVLIKASAGGGGKGMRVVEGRESFPALLESCKREAMSSFGNDAVLIEKYVQRPRHIEIQVFGDTHGNCVYLFERDCSVQRRHQKVLEEAPAPGMTEALRRQMGEAAVAAAKAVNYVGAGTVEFIVEQPGGYGLAGADEGFAAGPPQGETAPLGGSEPRAAGSVGARFYFMEMNTRLQVEHPVTEAITGEDLVQWQLQVASGKPLPKQQSELKIIGHAIEARICAENPENNFLPATGTLEVYRKPECSSFAIGPVRMDDGVRAGDVISPFYDSMLAKLIVHADTREQALARLDQALAQTHVVGVHNNLQFLRRVVRSPSFAQARLDTGLIERERAALFGRDDVARDHAVAAAIAHQLWVEQGLQGRDPFSQRDGWRAGGSQVREFRLRWHETELTASLYYGRLGAPHRLSVPPAEMPAEALAESRTGAPLPLAWRWEEARQELVVALGAQRLHYAVYAQGERLSLFGPEGSAQISLLDPWAHAGASTPEVGRLTAPMPGRLISFAVAAGDSVRQGQPLAVMEAMKMEHLIAAPVDGVVQELLYAAGDQVAEGAELLRLAPT